MDSKRIDIGVGLVLCALSVAIYLYAEQYAGRGVNSYGPNFFPQALCVILFLTSVALIVQALLGRSLKTLTAINKQGLVNAGVTLILAIGYLFLMNVIGFYLATIVFLYLVMMFLKQKGLRARLITSIGVGSIVFGIFHFFLKIPLPEGIFRAAL